MREAGGGSCCGGRSEETPRERREEGGGEFLWGTQQGHLPGAIWWWRRFYTVVFVCLFSLGFLPESAAGRSSVIIDLPPSPPVLLPSLSLCVSASSFPLLSQKICWRLSLWLMAGVDSRWGRALLAFINNSTAQPVVRLQNLFTPRAVCFVLVCADVSVQMINARITVSVCFSVLLLKVETEWHFDTLTEHVVPKYVYVVNSLGQLHSSTLNLIKGVECVLRGMLSPCCHLQLQRIIPSKKLDY